MRESVLVCVLVCERERLRERERESVCVCVRRCVCVCQVVVHHTEVVLEVHKTDPGVCDREGVCLCVFVRVCVCVSTFRCLYVCAYTQKRTHTSMGWLRLVGSIKL